MRDSFHLLCSPFASLSLREVSQIAMVFPGESTSMSTKDIYLFISGSYSECLLCIRIRHLFITESVDRLSHSVQGV